MPNPMIEINGLFKNYGDRTAVDEVSFSVHEGGIFGLLGPNGAGKTTTISILTTLFPPDRGQATIAGYDLVRETSKIKPLIGFVPQELALYPTLSGWDNLVFFGRIYGLRGKALKERIAAVLDRVGLRDRAGDAGTEPGKRILALDGQTFARLRSCAMLNQILISTWKDLKILFKDRGAVMLTFLHWVVASFLVLSCQNG